VSDRRDVVAGGAAAAPAASATAPAPAAAPDASAAPSAPSDPAPHRLPGGAWRQSYLIFGAPSIGEAERSEVMACLDSGWLGAGPRVAELERRLGAYLAAPAAVAVSSCTAALHLALRVLDLPPGSEVITTAMTFCATANAIVHAGHEPVFADCERATANIDLEDVRRKITARTRAIVPVHFAGRPCDMVGLLELAAEHDLFVVEDAAHALEATTPGRAGAPGRHCGTLGDFGCFSFYVTKSLTTVEGGLVVAQDARTARRLKSLALHGMSADAWQRFSDEGFVHYEVLEPGFKYNLTDLAASIGLHQLDSLEERWRRRQAIWRFYEAELDGLPLRLPAPPAPGTRHALHLFTCLVDDARTTVTRDQVLARLHALRIGAGVHYRPVHLHPWYRRTHGARTGVLPNAEWIGARTFSLPLSAGMTDLDAADVVRALRQIFGVPRA
jgi:dTDP-4-amino-4,6-dideoxygalactose transaminase